jgi:hypothetical protein
MNRKREGDPKKYIPVRLDGLCEFAFGQCKFLALMAGDSEVKRYRMRLRINRQATRGGQNPLQTRPRLRYPEQAVL